MVLNYIWIAFFLVALVMGLVRLIFSQDTEVFTAMVNGGCTFQQSFAAVFMSGMNAAHTLKEKT